MELTLKAVAPLGPDYAAALKKGFESRWIDWMPTTGKKSGAYSTGAAYDVHPYQLLNFNGAYDDVSTLAHESGHSMHSYLSNKNQPYATAHYSIFVAEVASTLNENLLFHTPSTSTRTTPPACTSWASASTASARPSSGRPSSPSSRCGSTRWPRRASPSPATP